MARICEIDGCENTNIAAYGLCWKHYQRARRHNGDVSDPEYVNSGKQCSAPECTEQASNRGLCTKHYVRWMKHGNISTTLRPPSYNGHVCMMRGCEERPRSEQLCHNHYYNYRYHYRKGRYKNVQEYVNEMTRKEQA